MNKNEHEAVKIAIQQTAEQTGYTEQQVRDMVYGWCESLDQAVDINDMPRILGTDFGRVYPSLGRVSSNLRRHVNKTVQKDYVRKMTEEEKKQYDRMVRIKHRLIEEAAKRKSNHKLKEKSDE